jgi:hypothetical protein
MRMDSELTVSDMDNELLDGLEDEVEGLGDDILGCCCRSLLHFSYIVLPCLHMLLDLVFAAFLTLITHSLLIRFLCVLLSVFGVF